MCEEGSAGLEDRPRGAKQGPGCGHREGWSYRQDENTNQKNSGPVLLWAESGESMEQKRRCKDKINPLAPELLKGNSGGWLSPHATGFFVQEVSLCIAELCAWLLCALLLDDL